MQKCLNYQKTQQFLLLVFVGHTFLSDSEFDWTPLMLELPNAPAQRGPVQLENILFEFLCLSIHFIH